MDEMNAVYIHIPKTAGGHTMVALGLEKHIYPSRAKRWFNNAGQVSFGHQDYPRLVERGIVGEEFDQTAFKFCFCRNPFDRAVSHYFWTKGRHPEIVTEDMSFLEFTRNLDRIKVPIRGDGRVQHKHKPVGLRNGRKGWFDPQHKMIDKVKMDFIGRYERLKEDLQKVAEILGTEVRRAGKLRKTEHAPYRTYYNDEAEENVRQYYGEDFERFGYDNRLLHG